jgi:hypothetical protein
MASSGAQFETSSQDLSSSSTSAIFETQFHELITNVEMCVTLSYYLRLCILLIDCRAFTTLHGARIHIPCSLDATFSGVELLKIRVQPKQTIDPHLHLPQLLC